MCKYEVEGALMLPICSDPKRRSKGALPVCNLAYCKQISWVARLLYRITPIGR